MNKDAPHILCPDGLANLSDINNIYLIGARGSGKTTVGRLLADSIGYGFCDLDVALTKRVGRSIEEIVKKDGWSGFRRLESETLREESRSSRVVFATGGGAPLLPENREIMAGNGLVIWLKAGGAALEARLTNSPLASQRPGLTDLGLIDEIRHILAEREPIYRSCCQHIINAEEDPATICELIMAAMGVYGKK